MKDTEKDSACTTDTLLAEMDVKLKRTYEDNLSGKLPDHIFSMFTTDCELEKAQLQKTVSSLETAPEKFFSLLTNLKCRHHRASAL